MIKSNNATREELIQQLQLTVEELPTVEVDDRVQHYMNMATGTYFCSLGDDIKCDYIKALIYFEDIIPILARSRNSADKVKVNHCYVAVNAIRRLLGIM